MYRADQAKNLFFIEIAIIHSFFPSVLRSFLPSFNFNVDSSPKHNKQYNVSVIHGAKYFGMYSLEKYYTVKRDESTLLENVSKPFACKVVS